VAMVLLQNVTEFVRKDEKAEEEEVKEE